MLMLSAKHLNRHRPSTIAWLQQYCRRRPWRHTCNCATAVRQLQDTWPHVPVLLHEVLSLLQPVQLQVYMDGTLGAGGHATAVLQQHQELHTFIGLDVDSSALTLAAARLQEQLPDASLQLLQCNFRQLGLVLDQLLGAHESVVDGILLDLGVSSMQLDTPQRGFTFRDAAAPLDMRLQGDATWHSKQQAYGVSVVAARRTVPVGSNTISVSDFHHVDVCSRLLKPVHSAFSCVDAIVQRSNALKTKGNSAQFGEDGSPAPLGASSPDCRITAAEIVNSWSERDLGRVLREYGEEPMWRLIARRIVDAREESALQTVGQLEAAIGRLPQRKGSARKPGNKRIHPLTKTFQALRIAVNDELGAVESVLPQAIAALRPGGRLLVISFHSLEDRIVKRAMQQAAGQNLEPVSRSALAGLWQEAQGQPLGKIITRKPITAGESELQSNPRARSAKLRCFEKIA